MISAFQLSSKQWAVRVWTGTNHGEHGVKNEELQFVERSGKPWRFFLLKMSLRALCVLCG
jgi:hypothetical protein